MMKFTIFRMLFDMNDIIQHTLIKHDGKIDIPDDIMQFIRKKCQEMRNKNNGE